mmetsp:Transcript_41112/g.129144  ORF Transcript_41112/g.129144 Transcript_41112/m.129144 type:complete len:954 (-) Transcript_41112:51-2912(-)
MTHPSTANKSDQGPSREQMFGLFSRSPGDYDGSSAHSSPSLGNFERSREPRLSQDWLLLNGTDDTDLFSQESPDLSCLGKVTEGGVDDETEQPTLSKEYDPHSNFRVYVGEDTYLLVPLIRLDRGKAAGAEEDIQKSVVVDRSARTVTGVSEGHVNHLKARCRDVIVAKGLLGIVKLEWDSYLVLLMASELVGNLPQGELRRISETKLLPMNLDSRLNTPSNDPSRMNANNTGAGSSSPADLSMGVLSKHSFIHRSFKDLLKSGWLIFSWSFDPTLSQQQHGSRSLRQSANQAAEFEGGWEGFQHTKDSYAKYEKDWGWNSRFVWNISWLKPFLEASERHPAVKKFVLPVIYGYARIVKCKLDNVPIQLSLIARRSRKRAGVRFFRRGIDDEGNVANFVETEQVVQVANMISSFVCVRGSIPLYWKQESSDWTQLKPRLDLDHGSDHAALAPGSNDRAETPARSEQPQGTGTMKFRQNVLDRNFSALQLHFERLREYYGSILVLNLVEQHGGEAQLGALFKRTLSMYVNSVASPRPPSPPPPSPPVPHLHAASSSPPLRWSTTHALLPYVGSTSPEDHVGDLQRARDSSEEEVEQYGHQAARGEDEGQAVKYYEFALHSKLEGDWSLGQVELQSLFGIGLSELLDCGVFISSLEKPEKESLSFRTKRTFCEILGQQTGVLRVNCIDCLDRTNVAQSIVARWMLAKQLELMGVIMDEEGKAIARGDTSCFPALQDSLVHLWADHGDVLSLQYAGSQALQSDVTRTGRRTLHGLLVDSVFSMQRFVQRSLYDSSIQEMLDWILNETWPPLLLELEDADTLGKGQRLRAHGEQERGGGGGSIQQEEVRRSTREEEEVRRKSTGFAALLEPTQDMPKNLVNMNWLDLAGKYVAAAPPRSSPHSPVLLPSLGFRHGSQLQGNDQNSPRAAAEPRAASPSANITFAEDSEEGWEMILTF